MKKLQFKAQLISEEKQVSILDLAGFFSQGKQEKGRDR